MNEQENKIAVRNMVNMILDKDDTRVEMIRPAVLGEPTAPNEKNERFETYTPGKTLYVVIACGPVEEERMKEVRRALGIQPF